MKFKINYTYVKNGVEEVETTIFEAEDEFVVEEEFVDYTIETKNCHNVIITSISEVDGDEDVEEFEDEIEESEEFEVESEEIMEFDDLEPEEGDHDEFEEDEEED